MLQNFSSFYKSVCWRYDGAGGGQVPQAGVVGITVLVVAHALSLLSPPSFKQAPFCQRSRVVLTYFHTGSRVVPGKFKDSGCNCTRSWVCQPCPFYLLLQSSSCLQSSRVVQVRAQRDPRLLVLAIKDSAKTARQCVHVL